MILGLLGIVIGLYAVRHILVSVVALALLLGIYWVANGIVRLYNAIAYSDQPHRGWMGFIGVLSVLAGIIVIVYPGISLVTLAVVLGVWLLIYGVMEIFVAFRIRSATTMSGTRWPPTRPDSAVRTVEFIDAGLRAAAGRGGPRDERRGGRVNRPGYRKLSGCETSGG